MNWQPLKKYGQLPPVLYLIWSVTATVASAVIYGLVPATRAWGPTILVAVISGVGLYWAFAAGFAHWRTRHGG